MPAKNTHRQYLVRECVGIEEIVLQNGRVFGVLGCSSHGITRIGAIRDLSGLWLSLLLVSCVFAGFSASF